MIKHIVMWRFKEAEGGSRDTNAAKAKEMLEALPEVIQEIKYLQVGENFSDSEAAYDLVLVTDFINKNELRTYIDHPEHKKVAGFIGKVVSDRCVVDYEYQV